MSLLRRASFLAIPLFMVIGACGGREQEGDDDDPVASTAAQALTAKELFGTYELKGDPFSGAVKSVSLLPGSCDAKQDPLPPKAEGGAIATIFTECADPTCKTW